MSLIRQERYVIVQPRDDGVLMGLYGTVDPHAKLYPYPEDIIHQCIDRGIVRDWDPILDLWYRHFHESMGISIKLGFNPVMFLKPATYSKLDDQIVTKFWFEQCNVPSLFIWPASVACLMGASLTSGIVIDVGYNHIEIVPISESSVLGGDQVIIPYGLVDAVDESQLGDELNGYSTHALTTQFPNLWTPTLHAPDTTISAHADTQIPGELRTRPADSLVDVMVPGILAAIHVSLADSGLRPGLADAMMVTGLGSSVVQHLDMRLEIEVNQMLAKSKHPAESQPRACCFRIVHPYLEAYQNRLDLAAYLGGSLLCRAIFTDVRNHMTRSDYDQYGPIIVHTKNYGASSV